MLAPNERVFPIEHGAAACARDLGAPVTIDHQFARRASSFVFWRRPNNFCSVASLAVASNRFGNGPPRRIVSGSPRCECMRDFMEDRVSDFVLVVKLNQVSR
jgi:hypothetical protein